MSFRVAYVHPSEGGTAEIALGTEANTHLFYNFGVYEADVLPLTFKGLALYNPHDEPVQVTLQAIASDGTVLATSQQTVAATSRMRGLGTNLFTFTQEHDFTDVARVTAVGERSLVGLNISGVNGAKLLFGAALGRTP